MVPWVVLYLGADRVGPNIVIIFNELYCHGIILTHLGQPVCESPRCKLVSPNPFTEVAPDAEQAIFRDAECSHAFQLVALPTLKDRCYSFVHLGCALSRSFGGSLGRTRDLQWHNATHRA